MILSVSNLGHIEYEIPQHNKRPKVVVIKMGDSNFEHYYNLLVQQIADKRKKLQQERSRDEDERELKRAING